jgi:hypothetical protein
MSRGPEKVREYLKDVVAKHPDSVEAHRTWQTLERSQGRLDELLASYRAEYERKPTAMSGYLYARLLPQSLALPLLTTLVSRYPDDPWVRRASAWSHLLAREFSAAAADYARIRAVKPADALSMLTLHATALVGAGRTPEAQRLARDAVARGEWNPLILLGRLERLPDADASVQRAKSLVSSVAEPGADLPSLGADFVGRTGDERAFEAEVSALRDETTRTARQLDVGARTRVEVALRTAGRASPEALRAIDDPTRLLLACEASRAGDADLKKRILDSGAVGIPDAGVDTPEDASRAEEIDLETRAILKFSASRRAKDEKERDRLLADAKADDVLRFFVWGQR